LILSIIVAIAKNGVIGKANGEMSWHVKEEFRHFKNTTYGYPIVMGRKTFETLGNPLKGRQNIVVTKNKSYQTPFEDVVIKYSLREAIEFGAQYNPEKLFIIGGGEIYKQAIRIVDEMIITYMKFDAEGEIKFPAFNENDWVKNKIDDRELFEIYRYERKKD